MRKLTVPFVLALISFAAVLAAAPGNRPVYDRTFFEPIEQVATPHIPWAKPLAGGPVRALFITHRNALREVVEIAQRLQMVYTVFAAEAPNKFGETGIGVDASWKLVQGNSAEELTVDLLAKLRKEYEVIVIANFQWDLLPLEARYEILKKVKAGTGLAGLIPGRDEHLARLLPDTELAWNWALWSGAANGIADWLGKGVFEGAVDYTEKHSGESSLRVTGIEAVKGSREEPRAGYCQTGIPVEKNTRYRFSVWYKTRNLPQGTTISLHPLGGLSLPASAEWKQASVVMDTEGNDKFNVYLLNYHPGDVWFDDASLTREGGDGTNLLRNPGLEQPRGADQEPFLTRGIPFPALPAFARATSAAAFGGAFLQTGQFRKGRICALRGFGPPATQALTPGLSANPLNANPLEYDYYLSLALRAILWATGRQLPVTLEAPDPPLATFRREAGGSVSFTASAGAPQTGLTAHWTLRTREGVPYAAPPRPVQVAGKTTLTYPLPKVPAGDYLVDLSLKRGAEVVNWASTAVKVTSDDRIAGVKLTGDSFAIGQPVTGTVTLDLKAGRAKALRVRQFDNHGRLVAEKTLAAGAGEIPFSVAGPRPLTVLQRLEVSLLSAGQAVDVARAPFSISNLFPAKDDVRWVMWDGMAGNSFVGQTIAREFRKAGLDSQYTSLSEWAIREGMWHIPYATRFTDKKTDWYQEKTSRVATDLVRDPCCTDPVYRQQVKEDLHRVARAMTRWSTSEFSLGDENLFVSGNYDLCFSPTCVADFRAWAKREFAGNLAALNKEYGTGYASWEDVRPGTWEDAKKSGNYAAWVDHRRHMETVWADLHAYSRDVIRQVVPGARVGYEGSNSEAGSYHASDYWKIMQAMDLNNLYYKDFQGAAVRDFASPGTLYGAGWYGGYASNRNEEFMRWYPWMALLQGTNSFWVWNGYGSAGSVMAFDTSLYPFFDANAREMREIKGGVGRLLMNATRQHDGVAVLWSPASVHVREFTPKMPLSDAALNSTLRLLDDLGIQARVLSDTQMDQLTAQRFKVLVLVQAMALSDAQAAAIRRFAEAGGVVVADLRPGVCNEHGSPRSAGALDDLFGVKQSCDKPDLAPATPEVPGAAGLPAAITDNSLALAGGKASGQAGKTPVMVSHRLGKGGGILANLSWAEYLARERNAKEDADFSFWPMNAAWRQLAAPVFREAGVKPPTHIIPQGDDMREIPRTQVARFRAGELEYVGVLQALPRKADDYTAKKAKLPAPAAWTVDFGRVAHVYDLRAGKYLGKTRTLRTPVQAGRARLFALLPYQVAGVKASAEAAAPGKNAVVRLAVAPAAGKVGRHVLRLRVLGPDGKEREAYRQTVVAEAGRAEVSLPLALDDAAGTWTLSAQDVATGVTGTGRMAVR